MLVDNLKQIISQHKDSPPLFLRNLLKETLQYYVLNFIYGSKWGKNLIMKGGTTLKFCFGLPRLSEDLDLDIENDKEFQLIDFSQDLTKYFHETLKYPDFTLKIAGNQRIIYLKFPVLSVIGLSTIPNESNILHIRIDLSQIKTKVYQVEVSVKSISFLTTLIRHYSLPYLFAGKLAAILTRQTLEGTVKTARVKGRDYYDLIWFLEKNIIPDWKFLEAQTGISQQQAIDILDDKVKKLNAVVMKSDLLPFFDNISFIDQFVKNYQEIYQKYQPLLKTGLKTI